MRASGTQGYGEAAAVLTEEYEKLDFAKVHRDTLHLFPQSPCRVLDIGAGTGRDAAVLSRLGHRVTAVEPTTELRSFGERAHADCAITWLDDALPDLPRLTALNRQYDLVLMTAVWMHLDADERARAMPLVAARVAPAGLVVMSLRHGPVPPGRRMFDVSGDEAIALAGEGGLRLVHRGARDDMRGRPGVHWTYLGFARPA